MQVGSFHFNLGTELSEKLAPPPMAIKFPAKMCTGKYISLLPPLVKKPLDTIVFKFNFAKDHHYSKEFYEVELRKKVSSCLCICPFLV